MVINKDEHAPIGQVADVTRVGHLFKIVPELTEKVQAAQPRRARLVVLARGEG